LFLPRLVRGIFASIVQLLQPWVDVDSDAAGEPLHKTLQLHKLRPQSAPLCSCLFSGFLSSFLELFQANRGNIRVV